ncbi:MAG: hypothetical protein ACYTGX_04545 [Planctomycetota bacterium]|jgi:hypothetical protein
MQRLMIAAAGAVAIAGAGVLVGMRVGGTERVQPLDGPVDAARAAGSEVPAQAEAAPLPLAPVAGVAAAADPAPDRTDAEVVKLLAAIRDELVALRAERAVRTADSGAVGAPADSAAPDAGAAPAASPVAYTTSGVAAAISAADARRLGEEIAAVRLHLYRQASYLKQNISELAAPNIDYSQYASPSEARAADAEGLKESRKELAAHERLIRELAGLQSMEALTEWLLQNQQYTGGYR